MNKNTIKTNKNKNVLIINSSYNLRNILLKKNKEEEDIDYNMLINHYLEKLYCNFDYINEISNKTCETTNKTCETTNKTCETSNKIFNYTSESEEILIPKLKFKKNYLYLLCIFVFCIYFIYKSK